MRTQKISQVIFYALMTALISTTSSVIAADKYKRYGTYDNKEYRSALRSLWTEVYPSKGTSLYCDQHFSTRNYKQRKKHINAEHVFPMSWVTKDLKCGTRKRCQETSKEFRNIESDLHNIYPANINVNKARSNYRFANIPGEERKFGSCDFEVNPRKRIAEPKDSSRGKIARSMLYMQYQYHLTMHKKTAAMMKQWDKQYPPKKEEIRRANVIQRIQGRENPFVTRYPFNES